MITHTYHKHALANRKLRENLRATGDYDFERKGETERETQEEKAWRIFEK